MEAARPLTVQAEVFGERLGNYELESLLHKVANGPGIAVQIARSEALVSTVEKREVLFGLHDLGNLAPLALRGVNTGGIVCTSVQKDDGVFCGIVQRSLHAFEVKALGALVKVWVRRRRHLDVGEDLVVVGPGGVRQVHDRVAIDLAIELLEEEGSEVQSSSAGDGLHRCDAAFGRCIGAEHQLASLAGEGGQTGDREIFMVGAGVVADDFIGLDVFVGASLLVSALVQASSSTCPVVGGAKRWLVAGVICKHPEAEPGRRFELIGRIALPS